MRMLSNHYKISDMKLGGATPKQIVNKKIMKMMVGGGELKRKNTIERENDMGI